jgi:predicted dehydrogenase
MIKWGVIGAGNMGRVFAESIKEVDNAELIAVASTNNQKLDIFCEEFKISERLKFDKYEELCKNKNVDAIYISTLNNTHLDLIKLCAKNKKNILCEKPFCLNSIEALEVKKIIENSGVKFFEAIAYLSHPQTSSLLNLINSGEIGEINSIESSFGFKVRKIKPESRIFNKKLGGGAILDVGCYPISFISLFLKKINDVKFEYISGEICETKVDIYAKAKILINNKIYCKIKVSFKENFENNSIIYGSKGKIIINSPWLPDKKSFLEIFTKDRYYKKFVESDLSVYANQIKNVSNAFSTIQIKTQALFDITKAFKNMEYLDFWMKGVDKNFNQIIG